MRFVQICLIVLVAFSLVGVGWALATFRLKASLHGLTQHVADALRAQNVQVFQGAVDTVISVASSKLGDQLAAGKIVLERETESVANQVGQVESELRRVSELVGALKEQSATQAGQLESRLEQATRVTTELGKTTDSLRVALASPQARGQWGERMAEDVLRAAGFLEGTNFVKQRKLTTGGVPDFTFALPRDHVVHMDVKFPVDNYLRWLDAKDTDKERYARAFRADTRRRVQELTERDYIEPGKTVDYLLLFVPNESVYGFIHEQDPNLIDFALGHRIVLCSPTTLFAVLAVIRRAMDNFMIENRSHEILAAVSNLRDQWERWKEPLDKMQRGLDSAQRAFDDLKGPRTRQFERSLEQLETFRDRAHDETNKRLRSVG